MSFQEDRAAILRQLTHAWSILERDCPEPRMRIQEAALLAGAGILYGAAGYNDAYLRWHIEALTGRPLRFAPRRP